MLKEEFVPPNFTLALHAKDLRIAMETAENIQARLDLAKRVHEILSSLVQAGHGELDHSAIYLHSKAANGL